jgi:tetratricopeptide (TPR) repeat protein
MTGQQPRTPFLGREAEIATLTGALDAADGGRGGLALIGGEPGIGKSRLADELAGLARDRGLPVLWGRAWEDAGAPAYWPWIQVLRAYLRQTDPDVARSRLGPGAADIAHVLPELRDLVPELPLPQAVESDAARFQLFDSTATFLRSAADDRPMLVVLDDLHAADTSSLRLLRFLAGQLADMRLLVVSTYRDTELTPTHPLTDAMADLTREPTTQTITVRGLGRGPLRTLIGATSGQEPNDQLVNALLRGTKGNPLYASEAVRLLSAEGGLEQLARSSSGHVAVPPGVRATIGRRLERLAPETRALLQVGAVVGPEFDDELLGTIAELDASTLEGGLDEAAREGLVLEVAGAAGRHRFSHDLIRETLYDELGAGRRLRLHRRAAEVLEKRHATEPESHLAELAYHFFEGQPQGAGDAPAVGYAQRAADEAARSLAFEEAARLYEMALAALERTGRPDPRLRLDLLLALGAVRSKSGDVPAAGEVLFEAAAIAKDLGAPVQLAEAALGVGGRMAWSRPGFETRLIPLLQDALVHLGGSDDRLRVKLLTRLACAWRGSTEQRSAADALTRQAVELARSLDDPESLVHALFGRFWALWWANNPDERLGVATEAVAAAEPIGDAERMLDARLMLFLIHTELSDMTSARRELAEMVRTVTELRQPGSLWLGVANRALLMLMEGDFDVVEPILGEENDQGSYFTLARDNVSAARFHRFLFARERGGLAALEPEIRTSVDEFPWYPFYRSALVLLLVETGRHDEARAALDELSRDEFVALIRDNEWLLGMGLAADAAARIGARSACETLYGQLLPFAGRHAIGHTEGSLGAVDRYLGLLAAALDRHDEAIRHLEDAVHINERMGARPWTAHSRADLAAALRRRDAPGDASRAEDLEAQARATAIALGMPVLMATLDQRTSAPDAAHAEPGRGTFRRQGDYWSIAFDGEAVRMKHSKGLAYLAVLLGRPAQEVHALDLASGGGNGTTVRAVDADLRIETDDSAGPALDREAKAAYRERVEELRADIAEAEEWNDPERVARATAELQAITEQLAAATGLGGRDRQAASSSERARISVTRAIKSALDRIEAESPALGGHLRTTVHTGTFCSYTPDPRAPITWEG